MEQNKSENTKEYKKLLLSSIDTLSFIRNVKTKGRRLPPIEQLVCKSSNIDCYNANINFVTCHNTYLSDDIDARQHWKCSAEMPLDYSFKTTGVSCEGYSYAGDPYVLDGSCGLEYTLKYHPGSKKEKGSNNHILNDLFLLLWVALFLFIICKAFGNRGTNQQYNNSNPNYPPPPPYSEIDSLNQEPSYVSNYNANNIMFPRFNSFTQSSSNVRTRNQADSQDNNSRDFCSNVRMRNQASDFQNDNSRDFCSNVGTRNQADYQNNNSRDFCSNVRMRNQAGFQDNNSRDFCSNVGARNQADSQDNNSRDFCSNVRMRNQADSQNNNSRDFCSNVKMRNQADSQDNSPRAFSDTHVSDSFAFSSSR